MCYRSTSRTDDERRRRAAPAIPDSNELVYDNYNFFVIG
jgi:hypothetical protein